MEYVLGGGGGMGVFVFFRDTFFYFQIIVYHLPQKM